MDPEQKILLLFDPEIGLYGTNSFIEIVKKKVESKTKTIKTESMPESTSDKKNQKYYTYRFIEEANYPLTSGRHKNLPKETHKTTLTCDDEEEVIFTHCVTEKKINVANSQKEKQEDEENDEKTKEITIYEQKTNMAYETYFNDVIDELEIKNIHITMEILHEMMFHNHNTRNPFGTLKCDIDVKVTIHDYTLRNIVSIERNPKDMNINVFTPGYLGNISHFELKKPEKMEAELIKKRESNTSLTSEEEEIELLKLCKKEAEEKMVRLLIAVFKKYVEELSLELMKRIIRHVYMEA